MDVGFSEEQEALRAGVRQVLADHAPLSALRERYAETGPRADAAWARLTELGVPGVLAPERVGGLDLGMVDAGVVLEECGRAVYDGPVLASSVGAVPLAVALGVDHLAERLVAGARAAVALQPPGRRGDWREPAVRADAGALDGTAVAVAGAASADVLLVVAGDAAGLGVHAVRAGSPGLTITPEPAYDGSSPTATVTLAGVRAHRLGDGDATSAIVGTVDRMTAGLVADGVGAAGRALELAVAHAREREQFGVPIGSFQAVQHLLVDMLQTLELGRAASHYALWCLDQPDGAEAHRAVTMAKAWASGGFYRVGASAVQVFGGVGFTWEHDIGLYYKRLLTLQHAMGTTADHLESLAAQIR